MAWKYISVAQQGGNSLPSHQGFLPQTALFWGMSIGLED